MKMTLHAAFLAGLLSLTPALAQTAVPSEMSYQAIVTDEAGAPLAPSAPVSYEVTMRIFNAATGGTLLWSERQVTDVFQGRFAIILGQGQAVPIAGGGNEPRPDLASVFSDQLRFTEITVRENVDDAEDKPPLAPRQKLVATATAMRAKVAEGLTPGGLNAGAIPAGTINATHLSTNSVNDSKIAANANIAATKLGTGAVNNNEFNFLNGVTSSIQNQLNSKANNAGNATLAGANVFTNSKTIFNQNVGIGTTTPQTKLHVNGGDITVGSGGNSLNAGGAIKFGYAEFEGTLPPMAMVKGLLSRSRSDGLQGGLGFYTRPLANNATNLTERVRISDNGNVGIGTTAPTGAKLVVMGSVVSGNFNASYLSYGGGAFGIVPHGPHGLSIIAQSDVRAAGFYAVSDERMKNIRGQSDRAADLQALLGIKITDYTHRDIVAKGNRPLKKVIAQQVEAVYPQAVHQSTGVVPDIYQKATFKDGWVQLATDLNVGDRVKLIGEKGEGIHEVLEVREGAFRTAFKPATEKVFVFGREVKDFRSVDYEAISMLNVSATQEIYRRLQEKEKEVEELKARLKTMDARMVRIEALLTADQVPVKTVSQ